jgi:hypothetical protein
MNASPSLLHAGVSFNTTTSTVLAKGGPPEKGQADFPNPIFSRNKYAETIWTQKNSHRLFSSAPQAYFPLASLHLPAVKMKNPRDSRMIKESGIMKEKGSKEGKMESLCDKKKCVVH